MKCEKNHKNFSSGEWEMKISFRIFLWVAAVKAEQKKTVVSSDENFTFSINSGCMWNETETIRRWERDKFSAQLSVDGYRIELWIPWWRIECKKLLFSFPPFISRFLYSLHFISPFVGNMNRTHDITAQRTEEKNVFSLKMENREY